MLFSLKFLKFLFKKKELVFFSEGSFYNNHYLNLIKKISYKYKKKIFYITMDKDDILFKYNKNIEYIYIKKGLLCFFIVSTIHCDVFVTTLTDIGNNFLKSKFCKRYIYFFHALASTHQIYKHDAFKNYDVILTNGEYQKKELKYSEKLFNFPKKKIHNCGYLYLEYLLKNSNKKKSESKTILFAPSWNYQKKNLINMFGLKIIEKLIDSNYRVIFRPHPELLKRQNNVIQKILNKYSTSDNFIFDTSKDPLNSMEMSSIIITDNSTIGLEFLLVFFRPTIYINFKKKIHNKHFHKINLPPLEETLRKKFGYNLNYGQIDMLDKNIKKIRKLKLNKNLLKNFMNKELFDYKNSSNKVATSILNELLKIRS